MSDTPKTFAERTAGLVEATGLGATRCVGSDRYPFSVVKLEHSKSGKTDILHLREDIAIMRDGGSIHGQQDWAFFEDRNAPVVIIKRRNGKGTNREARNYFIGRRGKYYDPSF